MLNLQKISILIFLIFLPACGAGKLGDTLTKCFNGSNNESYSCDDLRGKDPWGPSCSLLDRPTPIEISVTHPAEIDLTTYKSVAFTQLEGNFGEEFSTALKEKIVKGGNLSVVDRSQLDTILNEQGLTQKDIFESKARAKLGKLLPATVLVVGKVNKVYSEATSSQQATCTTTTVKGKIKTRPCTKNFRTGNANITGDISIIRVETGEQIQVKHLAAKMEKKTESTQGEPDPINENDLHEKNLKSIVHDMAKAIISTQENHRVILYEDGDLPGLKRGILEAQAGSLEETKKIFARIISKAEGNPDVKEIALAKAYFNFGVVQGYDGEYQEADRLLSLSENQAPGELKAARMRQIIKCMQKENQ